MHARERTCLHVFVSIVGEQICDHSLICTVCRQKFLSTGPNIRKYYEKMKRPFLHTVKEEIFEGEKFHTFRVKTFVRNLFLYF